MPHEKVREENRKKVIKAAYDLFVECSIENTTMDMIAGKVGITVRSVQNYFETKDDLIQEVFKDRIALETGIMMEMSKSEEFLSMSGMEQIVFMIEKAVKHSVKDYANVCCFWKLKQHVANLNNEMSREYAAESDFLIQLIEQAVEKGKKDGSVREDAFVGGNKVDLLVLMLSGLRGQLAFFEQTTGLQKQFHTEELANDAVKIFIELAKKTFGRIENI